MTKLSGIIKDAEVLNSLLVSRCKWSHPEQKKKQKKGKPCPVLEMWSEFLAAVGVSPCLVTFELSHSNLGDARDMLAQIMATSLTLQFFRFAGLELASTHAQQISGILGTNSSVMSLDLSLNPLGVEGVKAVAGSMRDNRALQSLTLAATNMCGIDRFGKGEHDTSGAKALLAAICEHPTLTHLDISGNNARSGLLDMLVEVMQCSKTLVNLNIAGNAVCLHEFDYLRYVSGELLRFSQLLANETSILSCLDISNNDLRVEGAQIIGEAIPGNSSLTSLNLGHNALCGSFDSFSIAGLEIISSNIALSHTVTYIDLANNFFKAEGAALLMDFVKSPVLTDLNLSGNHLQSGEIEEEPGTYGALPKYVSDTVGVRTLSAHLEGDSILTKIRLSGNGTAGAYLAERVKDKGHFVVVD